MIGTPERDAAAPAAVGGPMRCAALTLGYGVPAGDFAGRVVEVHGRAALIGLPDGSLLTLLAPALGSLPGGPPARPACAGCWTGSPPLSRRRSPPDRPASRRAG